MRIVLSAVIGTIMACGAIAGEQPPPTTATAPSAPSASTPKEALRSLNIALRDGDAPTVLSLFVLEDDLDRKLLTAMADYSSALLTLHQAAEKTYGPDGANLVTGDLHAQSVEGLASIEKAAMKVEGDTALVMLTGASGPPVRLTRVDGRWKLPLSQLLNGVNKSAEEKRLYELNHQTELARQTASEIAAGKYKEGPVRAASVWRSRLLAPVTTQP